MKMRPILCLLAAALLVVATPATALAHHMVQGMGSAPEFVDQYAHGASAASGDAVGSPMVDPETEPPTGEESLGYGGPTDDGINGPQDEIPGAYDGVGGPSGGQM